MPTEAKAAVVERAREWYAKSAGIVFTDYRGLKVKEMQHLRASLRAKGGELHVVKNTLFNLAAGEAIADLPEELKTGPTAIAFIYENESECAKVLTDYARTNKTFSVKGGVFGGKHFDAKAVEDLGKLPSREVLLAQLIGLISQPIRNVVSTIDAIVATPIRTIYAVADKLNEGAPTPAPERVAEAPAEAAPEPVAEAQIEAATEAAEPVAEEPAAEPTEPTPAEEAETPTEPTGD